MFVSVVIPLYNKKEYIGRAIGSVLAQTHDEFELIVVDDGSRDGGPDVARAIKDPRIEVVQMGRNVGVSAARNKGVEIADGEWVAFLDADDEYKPRFLERVVEFINANSGIGLSFVGANYLVDGDATILPEVRSGLYDYFELFNNNRSPNNASTTMVNRAVFLEVGGFPEGQKHYEDWVLWIKLSLVGGFGYLGEPLGCYHRAANSAFRKKKSGAEMFSHARVFLDAVRISMCSIKVPAERRRAAEDLLDGFTVRTAWRLARDGSRLWSFRMLRNVECGRLVRRYKRSLLTILWYLAMPRVLTRGFLKCGLLLQRNGGVARRKSGT
jgi:glycosyltransferase involved in cell wall biosynthesis